MLIAFGTLDGNRIHEVGIFKLEADGEERFVLYRNEANKEVTR